MIFEHQSKNKKIILGVVLAVLFFGILALFLPDFSGPQINEESAVRAVVDNFGRTLKNVSLLSPTVAQDIETNYKDFVVAERIKQWRANPSEAPGRLTSNPWPKKIEIDSIEKTADTKYVVKGRIIKVANTVGGGEEIVTERNVQIFLSKYGNDWLITNISQNNLSSGFGNEQIGKAVTNYLLTQKQFSWKNRDDSINLCTIENLDPEKELFPLYVWEYCGEYVIENGELKTVSGSSGPVKINYPNEFSFYRSDKFSYEAPGDGAQYTTDVKRIFPENLQDKIFHFDRKDIIKKTETEALAAIQAWESIKKAISNCEVTETFQSHNKEVKAELKNGTVISTIEPNLDDIIKLAVGAEERCERIRMATE